MAAVNISMIGYMEEILFLQCLQLRFKKAYDKTGINSNQLSLIQQLGQHDRSVANGCCFGKRRPTTTKKDPNIKPLNEKNNSRTISTTSSP